jgi:hypothetical protein
LRRSKHRGAAAGNPDLTRLDPRDGNWRALADEICSCK